MRAVSNRFGVDTKPETALVAEALSLERPHRISAFITVCALTHISRRAASRQYRLAGANQKTATHRLQNRRQPRPEDHGIPPAAFAVASPSFWCGFRLLP